MQTVIKDEIMRNELNGFLEQDFAPVPGEFETFLDIAGFAHHEDVITRIYLWFLQPSSAHGLETLFISTLLQLVQEKAHKTFSGRVIKARTQVVIEDKKRIDLFIKGKDENGEWHIVIESKIYHELLNDLPAYLDHSIVALDRKCGILLTLNRHSVPVDVRHSFINITHREWMTRVRAGMADFNVSARNKIYLEDLIGTIEKLTMDHTFNHYTEFYFSNREKINTLIQYKEKADGFVLAQLKEASVLLDLEMEDYNGEFGFRYFFEDDCGEHMYYTIFYNGLFEGAFEVQVVLELWKDKNDVIAAIDKETNRKYNQSASNYFVAQGFKFLEEDNKVYSYYLSKSLPLDKDTLPSLATKLERFIKMEFEASYKFIKDCIYSSGILQ